jgi:4-hydroxybenzoyl-CoA thioesterase
LIPYARAVRFEEVDAAGIVFFGRYMTYAHEAMEAFFAGAEGGYVGLVRDRRVGFPAVRVEVDYKAPLRYGDTFVAETSCERVGNRSATLRYRIVRADGVVAATIRHVIVLSDLVAMKSCDMPADVRAVLEAHVEA